MIPLLAGASRLPSGANAALTPPPGGEDCSAKGVQGFSGGKDWEPGCCGADSDIGPLSGVNDESALVDGEAWETCDRGADGR